MKLFKILLLVSIHLVGCTSHNTIEYTLQLSMSGNAPKILDAYHGKNALEECEAAKKRIDAKSAQINDPDISVAAYCRQSCTK